MDYFKQFVVNETWLDVTRYSKVQGGEKSKKDRIDSP
jgi:hypothetical protein